MQSKRPKRMLKYTKAYQNLFGQPNKEDTRTRLSNRGVVSKINSPFILPVITRTIKSRVRGPYARFCERDDAMNVHSITLLDSNYDNLNQTTDI